MASEETLASGHTQERLWRDSRAEVGRKVTDKTDTRDRKGIYKNRGKAETRLSQDRATTEPRMRQDKAKTEKAETRLRQSRDEAETRL